MNDGEDGDDNSVNDALTGIPTPFLADPRRQVSL
jgi:hypothetical protein